MNPGDALKTIGPIRSQKTGLILPREVKFVRAIEVSDGAISMSSKHTG